MRAWNTENIRLVHVRLVAKGDKTELTIFYTLLFVSPVNYFIRSAIERGAEGGLAKNFAQLLEVLGKKVPVQDAEKTAAAAAAPVRFHPLR